MSVRTGVLSDDHKLVIWEEGTSLRNENFSLREKMLPPDWPVGEAVGIFLMDD